MRQDVRYWSFATSVGIAWDSKTTFSDWECKNAPLLVTEAASACDGGQIWRNTHEVIPTAHQAINC